MLSLWRLDPDPEIVYLKGEMQPWAYREPPQGLYTGDDAEDLDLMRRWDEEEVSWGLWINSSGTGYDERRWMGRRRAAAWQPEITADCRREENHFKVWLQHSDWLLENEVNVIGYRQRPWWADYMQLRSECIYTQSSWKNLRWGSLQNTMQWRSIKSLCHVDITLSP